MWSGISILCFVFSKLGQFYLFDYGNQVFWLCISIFYATYNVVVVVWLSTNMSTLVIRYFASINIDTFSSTSNSKNNACSMFRCAKNTTGSFTRSIVIVSRWKKCCFCTKHSKDENKSKQRNNDRLLYPSSDVTNIVRLQMTIN